MGLAAITGVGVFVDAPCRWSAVVETCAFQLRAKGH